jgi:hypothetical protein
LRDVFYFTKSSVTIEDIVLTAHAIERDAEIIETPDGQVLNICGSTDEWLHCIPIEPLGRDYSSFEIPQQEKISSLQPRVGFIISYHLSSSATLIALLKRMFDQYGGWVGRDDNTFDAIYDSENIDYLVK